MIEPEKVIMLTISLLLDSVGELLPYISDIIGVLFIGSWILFRSQQIKTVKTTITEKGMSRERGKTKLKKRMKWVKRMKWLRPLCVLIEFIPLVSIFPAWTILVWGELQNK